MMVTFHIQDLMGMIVLSSDKGFPVKVPLMLLLNSKYNGCLTLNLKEKMVVALHRLLVLNVEGSMRVNA